MLLRQKSNAMCPFATWLLRYVVQKDRAEVETFVT